MLALFGINYSQWKVKKSVTFQMLAEDLYDVLVSTIQEADGKVRLDGQSLLERCPGLRMVRNQKLPGRTVRPQRLPDAYEGKWGGRRIGEERYKTATTFW